MPGYEVFGKEEQQAINEIFERNGGVMCAYSFDEERKGVYKVRDFEKAFSARVSSSYGLAVTTGTAALKVALKGLGVKPGDEVITQSFTFIATVEAIIEAGATPIVVDIDETFNMCPKSLENAITEKTKVILPVHMMGAAARMDEIMAIARKHNLLVLEDTAQGCGGTYKGKPLGSIGDAGAFSFDAGKTITTGEGGMVITSNEEFFIRARAYHDHGHEYSKTLSRGREGALLRGFNYRVSEIMGAIGLAQLAKLDYILEKQRKNKMLIKGALRGLEGRFREIVDPEGDMGDTIVFSLDTKEQADLFAQKMSLIELGTKNLPDAIRWHFAKHWEEVFKDHPYYHDRLGVQWKKSADLLERSIALAVNVNMSDEEVNFLVNNTNNIIREIL